ncbi:hypothetical protein OAO01_06685 [Oligoflexia bacterium]|nr:hypothetical protein [Oligoflexia bacterium]
MKKYVLSLIAITSLIFSNVPAMAFDDVVEEPTQSEIEQMLKTLKTLQDSGIDADMLISEVYGASDTHYCYAINRETNQKKHGRCEKGECRLIHPIGWDLVDKCKIGIDPIGPG